ncbi:MAG: hypothetical protein UFA98_09315 [Ruminococcus sp.]|nr:hypothetical protein [Ruminococcus sp.]
MEQTTEYINCIVKQGDELIYLEDGVPTHAGIIEMEGDYFYAGEGGVLVTDKSFVVHSSMANGLVDHGTYKFDEMGRLVPESYRAPTHKRRHREEPDQKESLRKLKMAVAIVFIATLAVSAFIIFIRMSQ